MISIARTAYYAHSDARKHHGCAGAEGQPALLPCQVQNWTGVQRCLSMKKNETLGSYTIIMMGKAHPGRGPRGAERARGWLRDACEALRGDDAVHDYGNTIYRVYPYHNKQKDKDEDTSTRLDEKLVRDWTRIERQRTRSVTEAFWI